MITLVLGGARSGKSVVAERLVSELGEDVVYIATAAVTDDDFAARVEEHRRRRPPTWRTDECGAELPGALLRHSASPAIVDSLGTWIAGLDDFRADTAALLDALAGRAASTVVVSEEAGMGVHPETEVGRRWRDAVGEVNQAVATVADEMLLIVAGRALRL